MNKNQLILANPLYWPAWLGLGILWLVTRLPYRWQLKIGHGLGLLLYSLPGKLKKTTRVNIQLCFPELNEAQQEALIKKNFISLGMGLIESAMSWWFSEKKLVSLFRIIGLEHAEKAFQKGKGIILVSPHFTCLEIIGKQLGTKYSFAVMFRPHKKKIFAFIHERFRKSPKIEYIARHRMRDVLRALNNNKAVWFAYDIDAGEKRSVFAPFFGIQTASLTSVSRVAELSGAEIIPIHFYRRPDNTGYDLVLKPPIENFGTTNFTEDATRLNAILEESIRKTPEQYIWQYKRFKTRPAGEKRFY